jgi:hypothetical protein
MYLTLPRVIALAVLAATPASALAAAPVPSAPADKTLANARKALNDVTDMNYQARSLNDLIADIKKQTKVPVILDSMVFQFGLNPDQQTVNVNLKQVKLKDGLKAALAPFNLKFGLTADGLFISTEEGVITRQLRQRVSLDCERTELATVVKQLAADTGVNLIVDPRLGDKATTPVLLTLDDVPLESAVRLLAEVCDLRAVRSANVLFITTAEKAKGFRDDGPTSPGPFNLFFQNPPPDGGIFVPPGVIGGPGMGIGGAAPPAVETAPAIPPQVKDPPPAAPLPPPPPPEKKG